MQQALALMLQAQANLAQNQTAFLARIAETDAETAQIRRRTEAEIAQIRRRMDETDRRIEERFARIEAILAELPEAVHRRFGFQPPRPPTDQ